MQNPKEDAEEKKLLEIILKKLLESGLSDNLWDPKDFYEAANAEMGYTRYRIDKKLSGKMTKTTTETESHMHVTMCLFAWCHQVIQYVSEVSFTVPFDISITVLCDAML